MNVEEKHPGKSPTTIAVPLRAAKRKMIGSHGWSINVQEVALGPTAV